MGHLHRDGIDRLRHLMGYSRQKSTICTTLADAGWLAGAGIKRGVDSRETKRLGDHPSRTLRTARNAPAEAAALPRAGQGK